MVSSAPLLTHHYPESLLEKARDIRLLVLDVDGVLTDGRLHFNAEGECHKSFHVHDGLGMKQLQDQGIALAVISSRTSHATERRMQELEVEWVFQGAKDKVSVFDSLLAQCHLSDKQCAYVGDDWPDLPLIRRAHLGVSVPNAPAYIREQADWVTQTAGGEGAIRELCDLILIAQGKFPC